MCVYKEANITGVLSDLKRFEIGKGGGKKERQHEGSKEIIRESGLRENMDGVQWYTAVLW